MVVMTARVFITVNCMMTVMAMVGKEDGFVVVVMKVVETVVTVIMLVVVVVVVYYNNPEHRDSCIKTLLCHYHVWTLKDWELTLSNTLQSTTSFNNFVKCKILRQGGSSPWSLCLSIPCNIFS